jgi:hypothetical protein
MERARQVHEAAKENQANGTFWTNGHISRPLADAMEAIFEIVFLSTALAA